MADHIVRRAPAVKAAQPNERIATSRMGVLQLDGLMHEHEDPNADLAPELELSEGAAGHDQDASKAPSSSGSTPRLAHTLRRRSKQIALLPVSAAPPGSRSASQNGRREVSTIAMPRIAQPGGDALPRLFTDDGDDSAATVLAPAALAAELVARAAGETSPQQGRPAGSPAARGTFLPERAHDIEPIAPRPAGSVFARGTSPESARDMEPGPPRATIDARASSEPKRPQLPSSWHAHVVLPGVVLVLLCVTCWVLRVFF
jgi:hypothetical protein